jgi:hypothetical protein
MFLGAPLVQAQQDRAVGVDQLAEIAMRRALWPLTEEPLIPLEAPRDIADADNRPKALQAC